MTLQTDNAATARDVQIQPAARPGPWSGLGTVLLYFILQFGIAIAILAIAGIAAMLRAGASATQQQGGFDLRATVRSASGHPELQAIIAIISIVAAAAIMVLLIRRAWPAQWSRADPPGFGLIAPRRRRDYLMAVLLGVAVVFLGGLLTQLLAHGRQVDQDVTQLAASASLPARVLLAVLVVCVAPFVEELVFRGVLLSGFARRMSIRWAVVASAVVFGCAHLADFGFSWIPVPQLVLLGMVLGWLRVQCRSLWPSITLHATNNLVAVIAWVLVQPHV